jgi:hypothetical protein
MKPIQYLMLLTVFSANRMFAQRPLTVVEDSVSYQNHKHPGMVVTIPEVASETVKKAWVKTMEEGTKSKAVYENGEWSIFGANLKELSTTPVNVYSKLTTGDSSVILMVSIELKKDFYLGRSSGEAELDKLKGFMKQFGKDQYTELAMDQLRTEEKKLRELEKDLSSYQKDESDLEKSIRSDEKTIKEERDLLAKSNGELTTLTTEISTQNAQFESLTDGPTKDERAKYIRDLEKRKKKLENDIRSSENKISKARGDIKDAQSGIPRKQDLQNGVKEKINAQEAVVKKYTYKANTIKAL